MELLKRLVKDAHAHRGKVGNRNSANEGPNGGVMYHCSEDSPFLELHDLHEYAASSDRYIFFDRLSPAFLGPRPVINFYERDSHDIIKYCLDTKDLRSYNEFPKNYLDKTHVKKRPSPSPQRIISIEEVERNAQELIEQEERQKEKAEKKRLKKLRQKEKKRQKHQDTKDKKVMDNPDPGGSNHNPQASKSVGKNVQGSGPESSSDPGEDEEETLASEFEDLDLNSCFINKAAKIAKRSLVAKKKTDKNENKMVSVCQSQEEDQEKLVEEKVDQKNAIISSTEDVQTKGLQQAVMANQFAVSGCFEMAVIYYTEAIKCNPKEFRLFGNRSFCYEKLQHYDKALNDADITLAMCPGWIKGYYRRGRALAGLKRYCEAALAFKEVLKQDPACTDAAQELMRVQIMQLMEMGFSREQSSKVLIIHGTVEKALEAISHLEGRQLAGTALPPRSAGLLAEEWSVVSGRKDNLNTGTLSPHPQPKKNTKCAPNQFQPELFPIWVGCLVPSITKSMISDLFSTAGQIHSVRFLPERRCAFVNYTRKEHCEKAIQERNGMVIEGTTLIVRYPDKIHAHLGISKSALSEPTLTQLPTKKFTEECYYWRNNGCIKRERCTYKHVPEHKGIDRDKIKPVVPSSPLHSP
ncbi:hypothetical protein GN956_G12653 [Arapaima gigas]